MKTFVAIVVVILFFSGLLLFASRAPQKNFVAVSFSGKTSISVEIAESNEAGLMHRSSMPQNNGMLFVFSDDDYRTFWMKNTLIPLDIIFVSSDMKIVDIKRAFQPCTGLVCEKYTSQSKSRYAIEVNANFTSNHNISIGDAIEFVQ